MAGGSVTTVPCLMSFFSVIAQYKREYFPQINVIGLSGKDRLW